MSLVQLKAFHSVATVGSFSQAANLLSRTQPAISDNISRLEAEYNILLIIRGKSKISLTEEGKKLFQITSLIFKHESEALDLLNKTKNSGLTRLRLIADSPGYITPIINAFSKANPHVTVSLTTANTEDVISALENYSADVGVLGSKAKRKGFKCYQLGRSPLVAFCSIKNELAKRASVTLSEVSRYPLVMREAGSRTRQKIEEEAEKHGINLLPTIETEGREGVRELVAGNAGVGFISRAELGWDERVSGVPIEDSTANINETLICLDQRHSVPVINSFWKIAQETWKKEVDKLKK